MLKIVFDSIYAWVYFAIGPILLAYYGTQAFIEYRKSRSFLKNIQEVMGAKPSLKGQLSVIAGYFLAGLIILFAWPIFIGWLGVQKWQERQEQLERRKPKFYCKHEYLLHEVTIDQAERGNHISDPLGMSPGEAFGHLNKAWRNFLSQFDDTDELWFFEIPPGSMTGKNYMRTKSIMNGYARIRRNQIVGEFVYQSD